jgi:cysteine desulfurase/selenocysteine lyase
LFNSSFNPYKFREDFHCLSKSEKKKPLYFDNACMTLKPNSVVKAIVDYYQDHPSCHNRAVHEFGEITTKKVENSRSLINKYINCRPGESIVFTKNTTESINMVANLVNFSEGDIVLTTDMEHNSNMLPWQFLKIKSKVSFQQVPVNPKSSGFDFGYYEEVLKTNKVKLVSMFHISNITGMRLPIKEITKMAHKYGALVLVDAAQSMAHINVDIQDLDIDFMAFSIHKMYGPTGVGILFGKKELMKSGVPKYVGGEGIIDTTYDSCTLEESPKKYEVGLQNYAGIIGAGETIKYLSKINLKKAHQHILSLNEFLTNELTAHKDITILGPQEPKSRNGVVNIVVGNRKPEEIGLLLSKMKRIMVRSGVHCGHSWYHKYNLKPSLRISLSFYNTKEEVQVLVKTLKDLLR